jgi:hypothetical protein
MQAAKDSFFMALCARLQQVNPQRTVVIEGEVRPGLLVAENEPAICTQPPEAFCIEWGAVKPMSESPLVQSTLMSIDATIRYCTCGANNGDGDRGRSLTTMDAELMAICNPRQTPKMDCTQATPAPLGSSVFWQTPLFGAAVQTASMYGRSATTTVFYYPEAEA